MIFQILFWTSLLLITHSYVVYPLILKTLSTHKTITKSSVENITDYPYISILIPAFNEEKIIKEKIKSVLSSDYPPNQYEILIGSDASTDKTNSIIEQFCKEHNNIKFYPFKSRQGKPYVIHKLSKNATGDLLILTDANIIFTNNTIIELIKYFKNPKVGLVDANMYPKSKNINGISIQEQYYISWEVLIKYNEGRIWGSMMGPFGGCFAIRKSLFPKVPEKFLVDDFFINMHVIKSGYLSINNLKAKVIEDVSNSISEEFRRKVRISSGNFQNLVHFRKMLWPFWKPVPFCFISHKVIRWITPFLLIFIFTANLFLLRVIPLYVITFYLQIIIYLIPLIDFLLRKLKIHIVILRFITHFVSMNAALLVGFIKYMKGINTNVWEPTERNQL